MFVLKKNEHFFPHPQRILQSVETVEKRLSLRVDKIKKDHKAQEKNAAEEWFPGAVHTSPGTYEIPICQLTPYVQFKGSCCVAHACCSAESWSLLCCRTGMPVSSGQTPLLWECHSTTWESNMKILVWLTLKKKTKNLRDQQEGQRDFYRELTIWKLLALEKGTFIGNKLFGGLLSLLCATRCKAGSSTFILNKSSLAGMQLWKYRQWIYMRRDPCSFHASLADLYKLDMTLPAASHILLQ